MAYTISEPKDKSQLIQTATTEDIEKHTDCVRNRTDPCYSPPCKRCGLSSVFFKRHDNRKRIFNILVEQMVVRILGMLSRWKCPGCNKTVTSYPWFALPYKRYTVPTIQSFSEFYKDPNATYRGIVDAYPLLYETSDSKPEAMMDHATIHRWITTMGGYRRLAETASDLIFKANPATCLHRNLAGIIIPPRKHRTTSRLETLLTCFKLVTIMPVYRAIFQVGIFPKLATDSGYT